MDISSLREMNRPKLEKELISNFHEQFNLRIQKSAGQLKNISRIKKVRKKIAQIKTVIKEMEGVSNG